MIRQKPTSQAGMAIISALLVVAAVAMLSTQLLQQQTTLIRSLEAEQSRVQAHALLEGGLDWARLILRQDARRQSVTRLGELWSTPLAETRIEVPGLGREAYFSGYVEDEQGKFNLGNLAEKGHVNPSAIAILQRLCQLLQFPTELAPALAQRIAAGQRIEAVTDEPQTQTGPAAPPIHMLEDLLGTAMLDQATLNALRPYVTLLPDTTGINVNTATAEVIAAAVGAEHFGAIRSLIERRNRGSWFNSSADFLNQLPGVELSLADGRLTTASAWFKINGQVRLDPLTISMQALVSRPGTQLPTIYWRRQE